MQSAYNLPNYSTKLIPIVSEAINNYPEIEEKEKVLLKILGKPKKAVKIEINDNEFKCPYTEANLSHLCSITDCIYNTDNIWSDNCILKHLSNRSDDSLNINEIAMLLNTTSAKINKIYQNALSKIRKSFNTQDTSIGKFSFISGANVCCVCESVYDKPYHIINKINLGYCSEECYKDLPPKAIELEAEYGRNIREILEWAINKYKENYKIEEAFKIKKTLLTQLLDKFVLKEDLVEI